MAHWIRHGQKTAKFNSCFLRRETADCCYAAGHGWRQQRLVDGENVVQKLVSGQPGGSSGDHGSRISSSSAHNSGVIDLFACRIGFQKTERAS